MRIDGTWIQMFDEDLITAGRKAYSEGLVRLVCCHGGHVKARIASGFDYETSLTLANDGVVSDLACDCRRAREGGLCHHEVALILWLESHSKQDFASSLDGVDDEADLQVRLAQLKPDELTEVIMMLLKRNPAMRDRVSGRFISKPRHPGELTLGECLEALADREGDIVSGLTWMMRDEIEPLVRRGAVIQAFPDLMLVHLRLRDCEGLSLHRSPYLKEAKEVQESLLWACWDKADAAGREGMLKKLLMLVRDDNEDKELVSFLVQVLAQEEGLDSSNDD